VTRRRAKEGRGKKKWIGRGSRSEGKAEIRGGILGGCLGERSVRRNNTSIHVQIPGGELEKNVLKEGSRKQEAKKGRSAGQKGTTSVEQRPQLLCLDS